MELSGLNSSFFDFLNKNLALHNSKLTKFQLYSQVFVQFQRILQHTKMIFTNKNISLLRSKENWIFHARKLQGFKMSEKERKISQSQGWKSRCCATGDENVPYWVCKASLIFKKLQIFLIFSLTALNFLGCSQWWLKSTCDAQQELAWRTSYHMIWENYNFYTVG